MNAFPKNYQYAMTMTRVDLFWRGLVRGLSKDVKKCHSCFLAYDSIYNVVSLAEELYFEWNMETTSAFLIFSKITDSFKYMKEVDRLCEYKRFYEVLKTRFLSFNAWTYGVWQRLGNDIMDVLKWIAILWYSVFWSSMEDTGIAVGFLTGLILDLHIEDVVPNHATNQLWKCEIWAPYDYFSEVTDREYSVKDFWN
jgi:hypothetical protein